METSLSNRCFSFFSKFCTPIYIQYKLNRSSEYAIQRYSSFARLTEMNIVPYKKDYFIFDSGTLSNSLPLEDLVESHINLQNSIRNNTISVGDVIKIFYDCKAHFFYVDAIGLKELEFF